MPATPNRIKVKSIEFGSPPFRKLGNLRIEFADRLTLIAGHNGIGKSTILGLIVNSFGVTQKSLKGYSDGPFFTNIEQIIHIAQSEVSIVQENPSSAPVVEAEVAGKVLKKRCAMTHRSEWQRARIVPRTIHKAEDDVVGPDAKIPLPTIYLGVKRLTPVGEADEKEVVSKKIEMHADDKNLMLEFIRKVISANINENITHQSIKGSKKKTAQPGYELHDALAISLGQDSLGSIATALASFNRLKREQDEGYRGGLLVIDELDVGFHPNALDRLAIALKSCARKLSLQIIATSHSPRLIEAIHPDGDGNESAPDSVIYMLDTLNPRLAEDQSLSAILDDMDLRESDEENPPKVKSRNPILYIYFEDEEGLQFFKGLLPTSTQNQLGRKYGINLKLIALEVGGSNLVKLPSKDPVFQIRIIIVDADTAISKQSNRYGNILKLPCVRGSRDIQRSPENTIKTFLHNIAVSRDGSFHQALLSLKTKNPSSDKIENSFFRDGSGNGDDREKNKSWWKSHTTILKRWGVIEQWPNCYPIEAGKFYADFESALATIAKRIEKPKP